MNAGDRSMSEEGITHVVSNVVNELKDVNLFETDTVLRSAVTREGGGAHDAKLSRYGALMGSEASIREGEDANRDTPRLEAFDRVGHRVDRVHFHPAWHSLMAKLRGEGFISLPYSDPRPGSWVAFAAGFYLHGQVEAGSQCPSTMTQASIAVLRKEPELFGQLRDKLFATRYDPSDRPWFEKDSVYIGMGMTEKQGGSDVRTNTTRAVPRGVAGRGQTYEVTGHKWFFSAPMCDAHLVLARTEGDDARGGLSCFFMPRWRADGSKNPIHIQRLKAKVGNVSNSSSEVEFHGAEAIMVGDEGRGVPTIIEMANITRLHCVVGSAGQMRLAVAQALNHVRQRVAFGRLLIEQPLMRSVLADMALETEAATVLAMRLAAAFDQPDDPLQAAWRRLLTPAAKFWVCKRAVELAGEAMEVFGGNGYVAGGPMARLYVDMPVNSIWEGSGNVMCLDVLRALARDPEAAQRLLADVMRRSGDDARLRPVIAALVADLQRPPEALEAMARRFVQRLVLVTQAALLIESAPQPVADAFVASRFDPEWGRVYGGLPAELPLAALIDRIWTTA
jgi:putative acyl-CoA dehydrogenase